MRLYNGGTGCSAKSKCSTCFSTHLGTPRRFSTRTPHTMDTGSSCTLASEGISRVPKYSHLHWTSPTLLGSPMSTFHIFYQSGQVKSPHTLLNSFGNSKTLVNMNASHHGHWLKLHFSERERIESAKVLAFALDKPHLTRLTHEHIPYLLSVGSNQIAPHTS